MTIAKLFINGRSQAVRIPKEFAFDGVHEVSVRKEGKKLILEPLKKPWRTLPNLDVGDADFMAERPDLIDTDRVKL